MFFTNIFLSSVYGFFIRPIIQSDEWDNTTLIYKRFYKICFVQLLLPLIDEDIPENTSQPYFYPSVSFLETEKIFAKSSFHP